MNRIQKKSFSGAVIILLFFLTVSQVSLAEEAVPLLPMTVKGVALFDSSPASNGTSVEAYLNGKSAGKLLINSPSGDYCFWISGTSADEGKPVTFSIDGKCTGDSIPWESGKQVLSLDLSVGMETDSVNPLQGFNLKLNPEMLTEIGKLKAFGQNTKIRIIGSSVTEPNLEALKSMKANSGDIELANSSEGSNKMKSAPGFTLIYAFAGMVGIALGFNFKGKLRKKG